MSRRDPTVQNPAAKMLIEIARTQDEEVGDGTTSVVVLAAEIMSLSLPFLKDKMHPTTIIDAYRYMKLCTGFVFSSSDFSKRAQIASRSQTAFKIAQKVQSEGETLQ